MIVYGERGESRLDSGVVNVFRASLTRCLGMSTVSVGLLSVCEAESTVRGRGRDMGMLGSISLSLSI